ncbi:formylglycine-generating enzyme family protein [Sulfurimonas sp. MAG313]|nr:formylglycine-generating enzyme family protein [Sulfurimonas sp. MAG313]MDF1881746.1 formylglycine-generating enzyme family protein [Sulfurimonas sp. MAG313]
MHTFITLLISSALSLQALNIEGNELILIKAGEFFMGSNKGDTDERPIHKVRINYDFYLGKYEVTLGEYNQCVTSKACREPLKDEGYSFMCVDDNCPVMKISWNDAKDYVKWLSKISGKHYRLPSEAEREYATRAHTITTYSSGDTNESLKSYAWYRENSGYTTHKVGSKKPNIWGLYDMHGNVWEWCEDDFENYKKTPTDGSAYKSKSPSKKVVRGGSWFNISKSLRSANRGALAPDFRNYYFGFRIARDR